MTLNRLVAAMLAYFHQCDREIEVRPNRAARKSCLGEYVYVTTWSTVDNTSVTSIIHSRHVVTILFHDCDKLRVRSVAAAGENRCREDAINMFTVQPTVIELVMLVATVTVVHCTLIKHRENLICS